MTTSLAMTVFKTGQLGTATRIDLDADVIKARIGSNSDLAAFAPQQANMSTVPKYLASTDQSCSGANIAATVGGGFDSPSTVAFDCADLTFPAIAADAGKAIDWIVIYKLVTNDADSLPLFVLTGFTPIVPANSPITVQWANTTNRLYSLPA